MPDDTDLTPQDHSGETAETSSPEPETPQSDDSAAETPADPGSDALIRLALTELQQRRDALQQDIDSLNQRKLQLEQEIAGTFVGQSDAIARRVKGFQEYLSGALQGMAQSVEQLELVSQPVVVQPSPLDQQAANGQKEANTASCTPVVRSVTPSRSVREGI